MPSCSTITCCRVCDSPRLKKFFDLGKHPLANTLPKKGDRRERRYSLSLSFCADCHLVQLNETVDPKILFSDYPWVTGTSRVARAFAPTFARDVQRHVEKNQSFVFELASNDGTFLRSFAEAGCRILGVDPAKQIALAAEMEGVPTIPKFFSSALARKILQKYGEADIVVARNVLYHLANLLNVMKGVQFLISHGGVFVAEFHYGGAMLRGLHYDTIYHEHVCYYTLATFEHLLGRFGFRAFDVSWSPINAGGLIVYASKENRRPTKKFLALRQREAQSGANTFAAWKKFAKESFRHREELCSLLAAETKRGSRIAGYGASARSSTLLNFSHIGRETLVAIADGNPLKQGRVTAGTHVLIQSPDTIFGGLEKPDAVFLLAWNFADEIMDIFRKKYHYRGRIIIPLPGRPRIVTL